MFVLNVFDVFTFLLSYCFRCRECFPFCSLIYLICWAEVQLKLFEPMGACCMHPDSLRQYFVLLLWNTWTSYIAPFFAIRETLSDPSADGMRIRGRSGLSTAFGSRLGSQSTVERPTVDRAPWWLEQRAALYVKYRLSRGRGSICNKCQQSDWVGTMSWFSAKPVMTYTCSFTGDGICQPIGWPWLASGHSVVDKF